MNNNIVKNVLLESIGRSEHDLAIKVLSIINNSVNVHESLKTSVIMQSARYQSLQENKVNDLISHENYKIERNQITKSLIDIVENYDNEEVFSLFLNSKHKYRIFDLLQPETKLLLLENDVFRLFQDLRDATKIFTERDPSYEWISQWNEQLISFERKWDERKFIVSIIALVKAGKSTMLNAWIGNEYLPSAIVPETMQIIRIRHNEYQPEGTLFIDNKEIRKGVQDIRQYLREVNSDQRESSKEDQNMILDVKLSVLQAKNLSGYGFDILDTPGTNEFGISVLNSKINYITKISDVIIYLIDFTKLNTEDEAQMFENLKRWKGELFNQIKSRLFFVVNKTDVNNRHEREKKMSSEEVKKYVSRSIHKYSGININDNDIILISAEWALLSRLVKNRIASADQLSDFNKIAFGEIGMDDATEETSLMAVPRILAKSGFKELEEKVLDLICSNRSFIFFKSTIDDIEKGLKQFINNLEVSKATLTSSKESIEKLKKRILQIKEGIDSVSKEGNSFKKKANEIVQKRLRNLSDTVPETISDAFARTPGSIIMINPNLATKILQSKKLGKVLSLTTIDYEISGHKEDLIRKIDSIDRYFINSVNTEYKATWDNMIEELYDLFLSLKDNLEKNSKPLIEQVEKSINETFEINLNPTNIDIAIPSFENYYNGMQSEMRTIIRQRFDLSKGIFSLSVISDALQFIISTIFNGDTYGKGYKITSVDYKQSISTTIDGVISECSVAANQIINSRYLTTIKDTQSSLSRYIDRYISIIENEIDTKQRDIINIDERIKNLEFDISKTDEILKSINQINKALKNIK